MNEHAALMRKLLLNVPSPSAGPEYHAELAFWREGALAALDALEAEREQLIDQITTGRATEEDLRAQYLDLQNRLTESDEAMGRKDEALREARAFLEAEDDAQRDFTPEVEWRCDAAREALRAALGQA